MPITAGESSGAKRKAVAVLSKVFQLAVEDDLMPQYPAAYYGIQPVGKSRCGHPLKSKSKGYANPWFFDFFEAALIPERV